MWLRSNLVLAQVQFEQVGHPQWAPSMALPPNAKKLVALFMLVLQTTSAVILTRYSKSDLHSGPSYHSTTLVVGAEVTKLVLSLALIFFVDVNADPAFMDRSQTRMQCFMAICHRENFVNPMLTLKLAVPAGLYTLQNNLVYVALANLEATTFQVGYQMKVITTAVLSVIMLNRKLSSQKWVALFMLTGGIVATQLDSSGGKVDDTSHHQDFFIGIVSVITCGFSSAFAGVYFEKILKGTNPSLWVRNSQLAFFSVVLGMGGTVANDGAKVLLNPWLFFQGWGSLVVAIVLVQAAGGLIVAMVVKYADNIVKGFATALSIVLCGVLSSQLFHFTPSMKFLLGSLMVVAASSMYAMPDPPAKEAGVAQPTSPIAVTMTDEERR